MEVTIDGVRYVPVNEDEVSLSILIPSVSTRRSTFAPKIADALFGQHERLAPEDRKRVEILMLTDAKGMLVGDKRNAMVRMSRGKYVAFVDDDDRVSDDYLTGLLSATASGADCLVFQAKVSLNGGVPKICRYSLDYTKDANAADHYQRVPNHITAVKRVLALACPFPSKQCGEDSDYAMRLRPTLRTQIDIGRVLYHYDYSDQTTETQRNQPELQQSPTVDVVILSKASTPDLHRMCAKAIETCIAGAEPYRVNVIVIEQHAGVTYDNAQVIYNHGAFNYNAFANAGAVLGRAPWVMVANSDLLFEPGWLSELLKAGRDCVSPVDPSNQRQRTVQHDEAGWQNGRHFSGWCFMVTRELWKRIGKFDDCVSYWCSDDVVIEQCRAAGVMPMVVPASRVRHLGSQTMKTPDDDLSWGQVKIFNEKYGKRVFATDQRYLTYCRKKGVAA